MAADLVPIRLALTAGDFYTLWAPGWRAAGDDWEAFLGDDEDLYVFESAADLVSFVRTNRDNDLTDHPEWEELTQANAHKLNPAKDKHFDLVDVEELVAEKPTEESVSSLADTLAIVSSIGSVCELPAVTRFFNGNPTLATLSGGIEHFTDKAGLKRWNTIGEIVGKNWDNVMAAIDEITSVPDVDQTLSAKATRELAEPAPPEDDTDKSDESEDSAAEPAKHMAAEQSDEDDAEPHDDSVVLGSDEDFWLKVGIDPVQIMIGADTFYTLRCYFDEKPIFLGRNGRINVFSSERTLARYLADEHDHDLSDLSTYDDIRTAATDGSLAVNITDDNVYVLTGLVDDIADGPDAVDSQQLRLAVELLRDVGDYSEDNIVKDALEPNRPLGKVVAHVLEPGAASRPRFELAKAVQAWEELEQFVESRLRSE